MAAKKATETSAPDETAVEQVCVVDDGTPHVGRAGGVNGRVCSAHAVHYRSDGTRRGE
jgi:hypothetical protein